MFNIIKKKEEKENTNRLSVKGSGKIYGKHKNKSISDSAFKPVCRFFL